MNTFRKAVQGESLAISAELTVRRDSTADDVRNQAATLSGHVDGIQVTDNPYGWVQMSAVSAAALLLEQGVDPVPILTCRDRNRLALQGDLAGLQALGVGSVILIRGHRVPATHAVKASTVFDLTGRELIALAAAQNPDFFIGTGARAFRPGPHWRAESLMTRANAGARFAQTQLCFNMDILRRYMTGFRSAKLHLDYSLVVSLSALPSARTATWLKENMGDSRIPAEVIQRLENAKDPEQEGIAICAELMQEISGIEGISGINLMTTGSTDALVAAIEASGLRS